jgi:TPP-dependent 2-oxoacid decarboxylase
MKYAPALTSETFLSVSHKPKKQKEASTSIKAILRSQRQDKKGVYIRITIDREHDYYPTTYYVLPNEFDSLAGCVKGKNSNKEVINSHIRYLSKELDDSLTVLKRSKDAVSVENLRKYYSRRYKKEQMFEDFFRDAMVQKEDPLSLPQKTFINVYRKN